MNIPTLSMLAVLLLAARTLRWRHRFAGWEPLWRFRAGLLTVELRRHAGLARPGHDSLAYPVPREFRVVTVHLAGLPLWSRQATVGLPAEADARIDSIGAGEFDSLFDAPFRCGWTGRPVRLATRPH